MPEFSKFHLVETIDPKELAESVKKGIESEPFNVIEIPSNGPLLQRACLGVLIVSLITIGVINVSDIVI